MTLNAISHSRIMIISIKSKNLYFFEF